MSKFRKIRLFCFAAMASMASAVLLSNVVFADATTDRIDRIVMLHQAYRCYKQNIMANPLTSFSTVDNVFTGKSESIVLFNEDGEGKSFYCAGAFEQLNRVTGKTPDSPTQLGYTKDENDKENLTSQCVNIYYKVKNATYSTERWCFPLRDSSIDMDSGANPYIDAGFRYTDGGMRLYNSGNEISIEFPTNDGQMSLGVPYYGKTWNDFKNDLAQAVGKLNGYTLSYGKITGDIVNADLHTEPGSANFWASYKINGNYVVASRIMENYYFGIASNSAAAQNQKLTESDLVYVLDKAYSLALSTGHIYEDRCFSSREEALKDSKYAHYDSKKGQWCQVYISSKDSAGNYTGSNQYALVNSGLTSLGLYPITDVLKLQTDRNLGNTTVESTCREKAEERKKELIAARDYERGFNGINTEKYKYLQSSITYIDKLISENALENNGICVDLPSVEKNTESIKGSCKAIFDRALTRLNKIIDTSDDADEINQARAKVDKINALNGVYWTEKDDGTVACLMPEDVYNALTPGEVDPNDPGSGDTASDTDTLALCYDGSGALGWIVCPVLGMVGGATEFLYDNLIEPALQVKASGIFNPNGGVYTGWSSFRDFANIIFAILFLIVIFSQVTGFGLDNYGIKKILPKLIMVAVLVNISFILCQLAVDVSNLLGVGLRDLFEKRLPVTMGELFEGYGGEGATVAGGIFASLLSYLGLGFVGVKFAGFMLAASGQTLAWLMAPLLIGILACLVSVLFFFVTLAVRQAGIIILIVLSPVAIVCYALPNTKGFFDKWKKLFQALLLVYPICGLLMGGGNYAGSLMLGLGKGTGETMGWFYTITAMLVTVVPFFFVPYILKTSMLAMGNLGMRISNLGKRWGNNIYGLKKTEGYQEWQKDRKAAMDNARVRALDARTKPGSFGNRIRGALHLGTKTSLSRRESRRRNRYLASSDKLMLERAAADANAQRKPMEYGDDRYQAFVDKIRSGNVNEAAAAKEAAWENSGVSSDYAKLEDIAFDSLEKLRDNFDDDNARAEFLAAQKVLESSDTGRTHLKSALNHFEVASAGKETEANRAARWAANAGMNRNGSMLKHSSPTLAAQYGRYMKDASIGGGIDSSAVKDVTKNGKQYYFNDKDLTARIGKFNPEQLSDFDENDLNRLYDGMQNGTLNEAEVDKLIDLTHRAFSNPNTAAKIQGEAGDVMHKISSVGFSSEYWGKKSSMPHDYAGAGESMAKASASDLAYLETRLNDSGVNNSEKEDILKVMRSAIVRAVNDNDYLGMSAENAQRMDKMIKKYGGSHGVALSGFTGAQQKAYDRLLSKELRIKHSNTP